METIIKDYIQSQLRDMDQEIELNRHDDLALIGFDSISYVRLLAYIKDRFGYAVPDAAVTLDNFGTVASIAAYLGTSGVNGPGGDDA